MNWIISKRYSTIKNKIKKIKLGKLKYKIFFFNGRILFIIFNFIKINFNKYVNN
jgi:hypothetical protein